MTRIIGTNGLKIEGTLTGFDEGSDSIRFQFQGGYEIDIKYPNPKMLASLTQIVLHLLTSAEIDFNRNAVKLLSKNETTKLNQGPNPIATAPLGPVV